MTPSISLKQSVRMTRSISVKTSRQSVRGGAGVSRRVVAGGGEMEKALTDMSVPHQQ